MTTQVTEFLTRRGRYEVVPEPLHVADLEFEFPAVLKGPPNHPGLVVVLDDSSSSAEAVVRRLRAFRTVLTRSGARRPITVILYHTDFPPDAVNEIREVCRVIPVDRAEDINDRLRPLLPLNLPDAISAVSTAEATLLTFLGSSAGAPIVKALLRASSDSTERVRDVIRERARKISQEALNSARELSDA